MNILTNTNIPQQMNIRTICLSLSPCEFVAVEGVHMNCAFAIVSGPIQTQKTLLIYF